jgi:hypothetical protein
MAGHKLKAGSEIIEAVAALGGALEYVVHTESPVEKRAGSAAVDVAWFAEDDQTFPMMIFEVESSATNAMANNPAKVYGQPTERFERPLFFFHIIVSSGPETSRIEQLKGVFGQHNYRVYPLKQGTANSLVKDILQQHRRIRHTIRVGALTAVLLSFSSLATDKLSLIEFAAGLGLKGRYIEDLARLALQGPEPQELFLSHLRHRILERRWPDTDAGYSNWFGTEWSFPIHLGLLFASNVDLRDDLFAKLRFWQEKSSYMSQIGPHFGLSRDYDQFMFGVSGTLWALVASLMCEEKRVCSYVAEQIWLTVRALGNVEPLLWYQSAAWGIHIAASGSDEECFNRIREFVNCRGGIPGTILYSPPTWIDIEDAEDLRGFSSQSCSAVPNMDEFKFDLKSQIEMGDVRSSVCTALEWLVTEIPQTLSGSGLIWTLSHAG